MRRIGFLGLGTMGAGMAGRLLDAGFDVTVHNRTESKAAALRERGARIAPSAKDAVRDADAVFLSLATSSVVEEMLFGPDNAAAELQPGAIVADMSTVPPGFARSLATRVADAGGRAIDACVLGNAQHAEDGELRFMIGGAAQDVETVRPALEPLAKEIAHLGDHGMGATAKLAMNLLMGVQMQALAEAIAFGEKAGLDRDVLITMITASGYSSPVMRFKGGVMRRRAFGHADFRLTLMRKDLGLVLAEAQRLGVPMPTSSASHDVLTAAINAGLAEHDCAAVLAQVERMSGIDGPSVPAQHPETSVPQTGNGDSGH
jgi:3-hydroxyisobutyrate dehydrogenase